MAKFFWRLNYAGRVMEKTRCRFAVAWRMSREAVELYGWENDNPRVLADKRMKLYR